MQKMESQCKGGVHGAFKFRAPEKVTNITFSFQRTIKRWSPLILFLKLKPSLLIYGIFYVDLNCRYIATAKSYICITGLWYGPITKYVFNQNQKFLIQFKSITELL